MATALTNIFGNEIRVVAQPRQAARQFVGLSGANGLLSMLLGTRGRQIIIAGKLASSGSDYSDARGNLQDVIDGIEAYQTADAADYSYEGETYENVVFDKFQLIRDGTGKGFRYTAEGYVTVDFVQILIEQV